MSKKIEFELVINSSASDKAVDETTSRVVSISNNLNVSLAKLGELQKLLSATGKDFPAVETLRQFVAELDKSKRAISRLKDTDVKAVLTTQLQNIQQEALPNDLAGLIKKKAGLAVGSLSNKVVDAIEAAYTSQGIVPKLPKITASAVAASQQAINQANTKPAELVSEALAALEREIANNKLRQTFNLPPSYEERDKYLPHLAPPPPTPPRELTQAEKDHLAILRKTSDELKLINKAFEAFYASLAKKVPVNVFQPPQERATEVHGKLLQGKASPEVVSSALDNALRSRNKSEALYDKFKPLTFYEKQLAEIEALEKKLSELDPGSTIWAKTANSIQIARNELEEYRKIQLFLETENKVQTLTKSFNAAADSIRGARTAFSDLRNQNKELIALKRQVSYGGLDELERASLLADISTAQDALKALKALRIQQAENERANKALRAEALSSASRIDQTHQLEAAKSKYGVGSARVIDLQEAQQLAALKEKHASEVNSQLEKLTAATGSEKRERIKKSIDASTAAYKMESAEVLRNSAVLRENSLAIQARQAANQSLLVKIGEFVIGYRAINFALNSINNALTSIPERGIQFEGAKATLEAMFVTTKDVVEQFEFLESVAARTGTRLKELRGEFGDYAASAMAAGESTKNIHQSFADLLDVATVLHLPQEKVHSAFVAISQMYAKNQVMAEELKRQLGNALPGAVALFARSQGMATAELLKQMKEGQVLPKEAVPRFLSFYRQVMAPEQAFNTASQGLNANIGRMQNQYTLLIEDIYKRSSGLLIGFTKTAASGLETIREHLDSISLVMKEIGALAVTLAGYALFRGALTGVGKLGIASKASLVRQANSKLPAGASPTPLPSANNIDTLAKYSSIGALAGNLALIGKANPALLAVTAAVAGLTYALDTLSNKKYRIADGIDLTGLDIISIKLDSLKKKFNFKMDDPSVQFSEGLKAIDGSLVKQGSQVAEAYAQRFKEGIAYRKELTDAMWEEYLKGTKSLNRAIDLSNKEMEEKRVARAEEATASILSETELAEQKAKAFTENQKKAHEEFLESLRQQNQKLLLQEPVSQIENLFDNKAFTRNIELVGRAVELQLAKVSQLANQQVALLEAQINRLDRKVSRGLLSPGQAYAEKVRLVNEEYGVRAQEFNQRRYYGAQDIRANIAFSEANDELAKASNLYTEKRDYFGKLQQIATGKFDTTVGDVKYSFKDLGAAIAETEKLTQKEIQERIDTIKTGRQAFKEFLASPEGIKSGVKDFTQGMPELIYKEDMDKGKKAADDAWAAYDSLQKELVRRVKALPSYSTSDLDQAPKGVYDTLSREAITAGMIYTESRFNPDAVSPKGARGLMQLLPGTAANPSLYGVKIKGVEDNSPEENVRVGKAYYANIFSHLNKLYPDKPYEDLTRLSLAGYNGGPGLMDKKLKAASGDTEKALSLMPPESRKYVGSVLTAAASPKIQETYQRLADSFEALNDNLEATDIFDKKNRSSASQAAMTTFRGQALEAQTNLQQQQEMFNRDQRLTFSKEDFEQAQLDFLQNIKQNIIIPFLEQTQPRSFEAKQQAFDQQMLILRSSLELEKQTPPELRTVKTNAEIDDLLAKLDQLIGKQKQLFSLELDQQDAQAKFDLAQAKVQLYQASPEYQLASPLDRTNMDSQLSEEVYKAKLATQKTVYAKIEADPALSEAQREAQKTAFQVDLASLKTQSQSVAAYFRGEFSSSLQQPFVDLLTRTASVEDALKAFGRNIVNNFANALATDFSNSLGKMFVSGISSVLSKLPAKSTTASSSSSSGSSETGSFISSVLSYFLAEGGEVTASAGAKTKTRKVVGPGTGTSDSIPALLEIGSYVINAEKAKQVRRVNVSNGELILSPEDAKAIGKENLDAFNFGLNFASGGEVGGARPLSRVSSPQTAGQTNQYNVTINQTSTGNAEKDGQIAASAFIKEVAKQAAKKEAARAMSLHLKKIHAVG